MNNILVTGEAGFIGSHLCGHLLKKGTMSLTAIRHHKGFEVYNPGESQTTSLKELIRLIEEALGKKAETEELGT